MDFDLYNKILQFVPYDEREQLDKVVMLHFIDQQEDVLTRNNKIAHFTTSAWIVNKEKTKVLMIYHNIYDSWAWVGGHADGDSNLLRVIYKEVEEETGLRNVKLLSDDIFGINIITVENHVKNGKVVNSHLHFDVEFLLEADENDFIRIKADENSGVKWVPITDVLEVSSEIKMKSIYRRLNEKLQNFVHLE